MNDKKRTFGSISCLGILLLGGALVVVGIVVVMLFVRRSTVSVSYERRLSTVPTHIIIENPVGDVRVRPGKDETYVLEVHKRVRGSWIGRREKMQQVLDEMSVDVEELGDVVRIKVHRPPVADTFRSVSVDLFLTVPQQVDIDVTQDVGQVAIAGVQGAFQVQNNVGFVDLQNVSLTGMTTIAVDSGDIRFKGRLPQQGTVELGTGSGSIHVDLPSDSAFILDASVGVGHIKVALPSRTEESKGNLHLIVGSAPAVKLVVHAETGSITIDAK